MRRSLYVLSAWTLLLAAACGPAAAPAPTSAPPAAQPTTAPAAAQPTSAAAAPTAAAKPTTAPAAPAPTIAQTAGATGAAGAFPTGKRGQGGMRKLLFWQAPTILNERLAQGTKDQLAARLVTEPLAAIGPDGNLVPVLASE